MSALGPKSTPGGCKAIPCAALRGSSFNVMIIRGIGRPLDPQDYRALQTF